MTPQNEAQMNEEFEKWFLSTFKTKFRPEEKWHWLQYLSFKAAYSLQQEKIDKLKEENKSLRSDLEWLSANCFDLDTHPALDRLDEIKARHKLDAHNGEVKP